VNQLQFHPLSRLDVSEAIDWYQARSLRAAEQFALEVEHVIERIAENPEQFCSV
jgi:plasmid stabilization system protein ParE